MKKIRIIIGISALALGLSGCSSVYYRADSGTYDDLYAVHDRAAIAKRQQAEAEARRAAAGNEAAAPAANEVSNEENVANNE